MEEVKKFDLNKMLGEGRYGKVFLYELRGVEVAAKRIEKSPNIQNDDNKEGEAMQKLNHPNVIKLFEVGSDVDYRYPYSYNCQV
jgi:serine/threonine protein kinase